MALVGSTLNANHARFSGCTPWLILGAGFLFLVSLFLALFISCNRLEDVRATLAILRHRRDKSPEEIIAELQHRTDSLSKRTWKFVYWQLGIFAVGAALFSAGIFFAFEHRLFPAPDAAQHMTTTDLLPNLAIGIGGGIIASVLTLVGDRRLHRWTINRRLKRIGGDYVITSIAPVRDTSAERVAIRHIDGCHFSITATGGPTGDWGGDFIVREDFFDVAHGVYRYPDSTGSTDWGQHELLFDSSGDSISVYGVNRSKPGFIDPFSYTLIRRRPNAANVA